jgi:5-methylcytosine-specific restriction endonuclease McrA
LKDFTSKKGLVKKWQTHALGRKITEIKENTAKNKEKWLSTLKQAHSYMEALSQANCFVDGAGENILKSAHRGTELVFLLGRSVYHFPRAEDFRRICPDIAKHMKQKYFTEIIRDEAGRNGNLQRRLLRDIDKDLEAFARTKERRTFTPQEIAMKLAEQKNICPRCEEPILEHHKYEGDHIEPWGNGGKTSMENLHVIHLRCNRTKSNRK